MTSVKEIGEVEKIPYEIQQIEWKIPDFFTVAEDKKYSCLASPTFSVTGVSWQLRLWPRLDLAFEFVDLYLAHEALNKYSNGLLPPDAHRQYSVEYYFGLKKFNDSVENLVSGTIKKNKFRNGTGDFIKRTQLQEQKSILVPGNILTIVCTMKWVTEISHNSTQPAAVLNKRKPLKLIRLDKLSENLKDFLGHKETCDVILKVKDKEFKTHRSILMARSSVFAANFKHDTLERQTGVINIPDCDPDSFQVFLDYLYSGKLEELSSRNALNLYYISDKYDVSELKAFCVEYLMQCLTVENLCEIAVFADKYDEIELISKVQDFFNKNFCNIFLTSDWNNLLKSNYRLVSKLLTEMAKTKVED